MKNYPSKGQKRKPWINEKHFDNTKLTAFDLELLNDFEERRRKFNRQIEESNIVHHRKTCPGCGFPTMNADEFYDTCIVCLWEGDTSDKQETFQGPPNYISLIEHRVNVSQFLREFLKSYEIETSIDIIIKRIREFEVSGKTVDRRNFMVNLVNILPVKHKKQ